MKIIKYYKKINGKNIPFYECDFIIHAIDEKGKTSMTDNDFKGNGCLQIWDTLIFTSDEWKNSMTSLINSAISGGYTKLILLDAYEGNYFDREWLLSDWSEREVDDLISDIEEGIICEIFKIKVDI